MLLIAYHTSCHMTKAVCACHVLVQQESFVCIYKTNYFFDLLFFTASFTELSKRKGWWSDALWKRPLLLCSGCGLFASDLRFIIYVACTHWPWGADDEPSADPADGEKLLLSRFNPRDQIKESLRFLPLITFHVKGYLDEMKFVVA